MLKHNEETHDGERPGVKALLERLSVDGRSWAEAELTLAKAELGELKRQVIKAIVFSLLGFAAAFCTLVVLSQAGIALLAPHVDGVGIAALIVGGVLLLLVIGSFLIIRSSLSWRTESIFFRWFSRRPPDGAHS